MSVRAAWVLALAACLPFGGCVAWRTHLDPGVREFPAGVRADVPRSLRLRLEVLVWGTDDDGHEVLDPAPEDLVVLDALLDEANLVTERGASLAYADGTLRVLLRERNLGARWWAVLTVATVGLVPFIGGRAVDAEAELLGPDGTVLAHWTNRAEATQVAHLLLLTGWNLGALRGLRADALRGVVVRFAAECGRLGASSPTDAVPLKRR